MNDTIPDCCDNFIVSAMIIMSQFSITVPTNTSRQWTKAAARGTLQEDGRSARQPNISKALGLHLKKSSLSDKKTASLEVSNRLRNLASLDLRASWSRFASLVSVATAKPAGLPAHRVMVVFNSGHFNEPSLQMSLKSYL